MKHPNPDTCTCAEINRVKQSLLLLIEPLVPVEAEGEGVRCEGVTCEGVLMVLLLRREVGEELEEQTWSRKVLADPIMYL